MDKIFEYLGYTPTEGEEGTEKFQEFFNSKFVARDKATQDPELIKKFEGSRIGSINTAAKRLFGDELGLTSEDFANNKLEDVLAQVKEKYSKQIGDLHSKAKDGNDKKVNDLLAQLEDKDKSLKAYQDNLKTLEGEFNSFKESKQSEITNYMVGHQLNEIYSKVPFKDGMTEIEKSGFKAIVGQTAKFGLSEENQLIVRDSEGNPVKSKKSASEFASPLEVLTSLAEENGLMKKNNAAPAKAQTVKTEPNGDGRTLSPAYLRMKAKVQG
jgi:hypothetical protein